MYIFSQNIRGKYYMKRLSLILRMHQTTWEVLILRIGFDNFIRVHGHRV